MIDVITPEMYEGSRSLLSEMFRLRYRVFCERLEWEVHTKDGEERDEFDELGPTYFLARDLTGHLTGAWRILPTTGPNMLRDTFPQLLEGQPVPVGDHVWEASRFAVDCGEGRCDSLAAISSVTNELFCGLVEYCLEMGIRKIVTVYDIRVARLLPRIGCYPIWKTRPQRVGKTLALAGGFESSHTVLTELRDAGGITGSVIQSAPWNVPNKAA